METVNEPTTNTTAAVSTSANNPNTNVEAEDMLSLHRRLLGKQQDLAQALKEAQFIRCRHETLETLIIATRAQRVVHPLQMTADEKRGAVVMLGGNAKLPVDLVPIRLDVDMDGYKLRDTLMWNLNEETLSMEEFAEITCRDFDLPPTIGQAVIKSMKEQLQEHREAATMLRNAGGLTALKGVRVRVKLDVTVGLLQLIDQLEWDLGTSLVTPSTFSEQYVRELGLPREFVVVIANDILEQIAHIRRALLLVGFTKDADGTIKANDVDLQSLILPPVGNVRRDPMSLNEFTPLITELEAMEVEKIELGRDREARRKRRQTRGRRMAVDGGAVSMAGWTHISPPKTMLTPLSYRGSLHRVTTMDDDDVGDSGGASSNTRSARSRRRR
jgi:hypothetical protein